MTSFATSTTTTTSTGPLAHGSPDSLATRFQRDGFVHLGRVLDQAHLQEIRAEEARLRQDLEVDPYARARTIFINNVCWRSEPVRRFCQQGRHLDQVQQLLGADLLLWWTQFVTKMPEDQQASSVFPWHQDCGYLDIMPSPVTVWIALDDVDLRNGCIWVMPGSHHGGLLPHGKVSADSWHLTVAVAGEGQAVPLAAGEAVAFTGHTLHRSLANHTGQARRAFFCEYATASARESLTHRPLLPERDVHLVRGYSGR